VGRARAGNREEPIRGEGLRERNRKMPYLSRMTAALVAALLAMALALPAMAQRPVDHNAAGVIAAVVHVEDSLNDLVDIGDVNIEDINVIVIRDSLNNALRNSPILSNNVVTLQNFLNSNECSVVAVCNVRILLNNVLSNNNIAISDVVAIDVLSGGDVTIFVQPQA
jgi:hypothetical protein